MERSINRDDFRAVVRHELERRGLLDKSKYQQDGLVWWICDDYEIRDEQVIGKYSLSFHDAPPDSYSRWKSYDPLQDTPDLFLRLASLSEAADFDTAALEFCRKYGIPGGTSYSRAGRWDRMDLKAFKEEADRAWRVLKIYEAVLNRDADEAQRHIAASWDEIGDFPGLSDDLAEALRKEAGEEALQALILHDSLKVVVGLVNRTVEAVCSYRAALSLDLFNLDALKVRAGWRFGNLLGAAYLQMRWLMESDGDLSQCEYCARTLSLARPHLEGRKCRSDKRFCNDACRQARHREKKRASGS